MPQPHYVSQTQILKKIAKNPKCSYEWTKHSLLEMVDRKPYPATAEDVSHCVMNCQVVLEEYKQDILWRARGRDLDGNPMEVVVAAFEDGPRIKVVTVI